MKKSQMHSAPTDLAVQAKTSKTWPEWFKTLDAAGARRMGRKGIVTYLSSRYLLTRWWQQTIALAYEQARGPRPKPATDRRRAAPKAR